MRSLQLYYASLHVYSPLNQVSRRTVAVLYPLPYQRYAFNLHAALSHDAFVVSVPFQLALSVCSI